MEKNNCINFFKAIACIMVVFIHIKFPGTFGDIVDTLARFGVPFFFMVSGYFSYNKDNKYFKRQLKKIFSLSLLGLCLYFFFYLILSFISGDFIWITNMFTLGNLKYFILFNFLPFGSHLWYLFALLYVYIIVFIFEKIFKKIKFIIYVYLYF